MTRLWVPDNASLHQDLVKRIRKDYVLRVALSHVNSQLGGGVKYYFVLPLPREMIQFDLHIFFKWVGEKPPTSPRRIHIRVHFHAAYITLLLIGSWKGE